MAENGVIDWSTGQAAELGRRLREALEALSPSS